MKRIIDEFLLVLFVLIFYFYPINESKALDQNYLRNGECYMLIDSPGIYKGIYRLNNPVSGVSGLNERVISADEINKSNGEDKDGKPRATIGISVDLNRNIYTFTEIEAKDPVMKTDYIYRQVLDSSNGMTEDLSDYGTWSYFHWDARKRGKGSNIYRTNNQSEPRYIKNSGSIKALGPGTPVSKPNGYKLPALGNPSNDSDYLALKEYVGRNWYKIPNGSWYSSWHRNLYSSSSGYMVYSDRELAIEHTYKKLKWENKIPDSNTYVDYPDMVDANTAPVVAIADAIYTEREYVCGCLDSCQADGGSGTTEPAEKKVDIAMQPPMKDGGGDRVYSLSRDENSSEYSLTISRGEAPAVDYSGDVRGYPDNTDSYWVGISLKDKNSDYVYVMGNSTIKNWYTLCWNKPLSGMNITAATVSNQWNQKGGIVYAYDKGNNIIHKFDCVDYGNVHDPGLSQNRYRAISIGNAISEVGGDSNNCEVDDIRADGFGNLYFGLSFPTTNVDVYDPAKHFKPEQAIHMCVVASEGNYKKLNFVYPLEYAKVVFERNYMTGAIKEIGRKTYAKAYFNMEVKVSYPCYVELLGKSLPNNEWCGIISNYSQNDPNIGINGVPFHTINFKETHPFRRGRGCGHTAYSEWGNPRKDPGYCKLAVINVPTPPKVYSIDNTKKSYLDIIGPYDIFPVPDPENNSTCQGNNLLKGLASLQPDKLYFYMVENYPLYDHAQDPNVNRDWDEDSRAGGFISSIIDPYPAGNSNETLRGTIRYHWKTWNVQDLYGKACLRVSNETLPYKGMPYTYFYSPVPGKYILACRVSYDWYDYDEIKFGETIERLLDSDVKRLNTFAVPSSAGSLSQIAANSRLNEIMNMPDFSFMKTAIDQNNNPIDYSPIYSGTNGEFWALEPIVCSGSPPPPNDDTKVAMIKRCDYIESDDPYNLYLSKDEFWSSVPSQGYFGIQSGEKYHWQINLASQTNLFIDVAGVNGTVENQPGYNCVAAMLLDQNSPNYANNRKNIVFENEVGDVRWADEIIEVNSYLEYAVPGSNTKEKKWLISDDSNTAIPGEPKKVEVTNVSNISDIWKLNKPISAFTGSSLPPTDPMVATLVIEMKRRYEYDAVIYTTDNTTGKKIAIGKMTVGAGVMKLTGSANVHIVDTKKPSIVWDKTSPLNLFGETGGVLQAGVGPAGKVNPEKIYFTVNDNNPWEAYEGENGISLEEHIQNYAYNYGVTACAAYCSYNEKLVSVYNNISSNLEDYNVKDKIEAAKKADPAQPSSHYNYKPLFSKAARDVRLAFDSSSRSTVSDLTGGKGKVTVGRANELFNNPDRNFADNSSPYALHYHEGMVPNGYLSISKQSYATVNGETTDYEANIEYQMEVANIKLGADNDNRIPDGYANNSPGYFKKDSFQNEIGIKPYKFYVSVTDSSGNFIGESDSSGTYRREQVLNLVLNVKDTIRPIGFGSAREMKDGILSFFPHRTSEAGNATDSSYAPNYSLSGQNYFSTSSGGLMPVVLAAKNWESVGGNGYINGVVPGSGFYNYQTFKFFGANIKTDLENDSSFLGDVALRLSPRPTEDNVESVFDVYVTDNAGMATATLTVKYYNNDGRGAGGQYELTGTVISGWKSATQMFGTVDNTICGIATDSLSKPLHIVFRGNSSQFPMAIPIVIESMDNSRDWDWYETGSVDLENGGTRWRWGTYHRGADTSDKNIRTFKTSLPVFGTNLNIRTLDKSVVND